MNIRLSTPILALAATGAFAFPNYSIYPLPPVPGGADYAYPFEINDNLQVIFQDDDATNTVAARWSPSTGTVAFPRLAGKSYATAFCMDALGNSYGNCLNVEFNVDAVPVMWDRNGQLTSLGVPAGFDWATAWGTNDQGQVVGWAGMAGGNGRRGIRYTPGVGWEIFQPIGADTETGFSDINNRGEISGWSNNSAAVWVNGLGKRCDTPAGGVAAYPNSITEQGRLAGYYGIGGGLYNAGVWNLDGKFVGVDQLPGFPSMDCVNVDASTNVVLCAAYDSADPDYFVKATIWTPWEGTQDFNLLIDPATDSGWNCQLLIDSNSDGVCAGYGRLNGVSTGFYAVPVVTPNKIDVTFGRVAAGGLQSLGRDDDNAIRVAKFLVPNQLVAPITVAFEARSPVGSLSELMIRTRSRMTIAGAFGQTLELFDWSTGQYSPVDARLDVLTTTQKTVELKATGALSRYLGTGRTLKGRYRIKPTGPVANSNYASEHDSIEFVTKP